MDSQKVILEKSHRSNERGAAGLMALLIIGGLAFYATSGYQLVDADRNSPVHLPVIVILSIVGVFAIGCTIHMNAIGTKNYREIRHDLERRLDEVARLIDETKLRIRSFENNSMLHFAGLTRRAQDALSLMRRIVCALETRYSDVKQLLSTGNKIDLIDAFEIFHRKLIVTENSLTALIDSDPVPALSPDEWEGNLTKLVQEFDREIQRLEHYEEDYQRVA